MTTPFDNVIPLFSASRAKAMPLACLEGGMVGAFPVVDSVIAYWDSLRSGRGVPERSAIDPSLLSQALSHIFLAEVVAPGVARIRLSGQGLADLLGMEPRGMPLSILFALSARSEISLSVRHVMTGARVTLPIRAEIGFGKPGLDGMIALMPLLDHMGKPSRILGVVETVGQIGRAPRRFTLRIPPRQEPGLAPFTVIDGAKGA